MPYLCVDFWKALKDFKDERIRHGKSLRWSKKELEKKSDIESFAVWLNSDWPKYAKPCRR